MRIRLVALVSAVCVAALWGCTPPGASNGPKGSPARTVTLFAGQAGAQGTSDGTGAAAAFSYPAGAVVLGSFLYVADSGNSTIRRIDIGTGAVTTLAVVAGSPGWYVSPMGASPLFYHLEAITTDGGANLYVADSGDNVIVRVVAATGVVTTVAGTAGLAGAQDTAGSSPTNPVSFNNPLGITFASGNLYVADSGNGTIRKVTLGGTVTTIAGSAVALGFADGTGAGASFFGPYGITTDGTDLYVADTGNHVIRRVTLPAAVVTTIAGQPGVKGNSDGTGAAAAFDWPEGIASDGTNLYVADTVNCTIRQVVIGTWAVTTLAGQAGVAGAADGAGDVATFNDPMGLTWSTPKLYVSDMFNSTIRVVQ